MKVWYKRASAIFKTLGHAATIAVATALLSLCGCQDSLAIKDFVQQRVQDAQTMLRISDDANGSAIPPGGTVQWPAMIFTYNNTKTFRLTNHGASSVTLSGTTPVGINGGTGQAAYVNGLTQPIALTLQPGESTTFPISGGYGRERGR